MREQEEGGKEGGKERRDNLFRCQQDGFHIYINWGEREERGERREREEK